MTKELDPCPFCNGDVVHEFKTSKSGEPCGDGLYVCQNVECGAAFKFPQDWSLSMSRNDESERRFNTRYKRTCKIVSSMEIYDEYDRYVEHTSWELSCGHETITAGQDEKDPKPRFCDVCGAEVIND